MKTKIIQGLTCHYRDDNGDEVSGDERILEEVITRRSYRRASIGFDVEKGERWLDLGANIGAFGLYCRSRGATAMCYEPDPDCYRVLRKNVQKMITVNAAVTALNEPTITFFASNRNTHARGTILPVHGYVAQPPVKNVWAGALMDKEFDGIKMDIEGSEGAILDKWLLPRANKLVLEYHTSRDDSTKALRRRLNAIKKRYRNIWYEPEYDRALESGAERFKSFYDRLIYAWELK
jgi:FkbM family methyltransferase